MLYRLRWKQPAAEIKRFFHVRDGSLLGWAQNEQTLYSIADEEIQPLCQLPALLCTGTEALYPGENTPYDCLIFANDACFGWQIAENAVTQLFACDMSMLQLLLLYAPDAFIDYHAAQAGFDSPEFLRLLELAKRQTQPEAESPHEAAAAGCQYSQILIKRRRP